MAWNAEFTPSATRDISELASLERARLLKRVAWLAQNFDLLTPISLHGEWRDFYKFRAGDYRIVYNINYDIQLIRIEYIDRRDRVYKRK